MANIDASDDLLRCPITMDIFRDPVLAPDGYTYEREAINEWIQRNGTSPMTREPLSIERLYPNRTVKGLVDIFETLMRQKNYQFLLDTDVRKKIGQPIFRTNGKTIYSAEWLPNNNNRPEIVLLKLDGARAQKEASFYVDLSRHPHITRTFGLVYDKNITNQNNTVLLLQEYAARGSLYDLLDELRSVPHERVLVQMFLQIIDAMIYLASNHVVHGDLACRNVLVFRFDENQPEKNIVKITDFGLSRHSRLYFMTPDAAKTKLDILPVRYAAPEVLLSHTISEVYTEKSDVYSMGVLMWEAFGGGTLPWADIADDDDVISKVTRGDCLPQPPSCSHPLWTIIRKTWSTSPINRPTFTELKNLLASQYYRSDIGCTSENRRVQCHSNDEFSAIELQEKTAQQHQEEQDRKVAQMQQEEQDRKLAEEYASLEQLSLELNESVVKTDNQRITPRVTYRPLSCHGRHCVTCGKCRDWYFTGHPQTWQWIRNVANWTDTDWESWRVRVVIGRGSSVVMVQHALLIVVLIVFFLLFLMFFILIMINVCAMITAVLELLVCICRM